jgi:hypothetical protein
VVSKQPELPLLGRAEGRASCLHKKERGSAARDLPQGRAARPQRGGRLDSEPGGHRQHGCESRKSGTMDEAKCKGDKRNKCQQENETRRVYQTRGVTEERGREQRDGVKQS